MKPGIEKVEYWENYLQGLLDTLATGVKGRYRRRAYWGPDKEITEAVTW